MNCGRRSLFQPRSPRECALSAVEGLTQSKLTNCPSMWFRGPKLAVLIVPWSAMLDPLDLDIQDLKLDAYIHPLPTPSGWSRQFCFEGVAIIPPQTI
jgi:hypothetical protein